MNDHNEAIEFVKWLWASWKTYYASHGTKILGWVGAALGTLQACLALVTASPEFKLLVTPRQFAMLVVFNIVLGVLVVRRGFVNSKS